MQVFPVVASDAVCRQPFRDAIDWTHLKWPPEAESMTTAEWEEMMAIVIPQIVKAGEAYLDNCVDSGRPLPSQMEHINAMRQLAMMIWPPDTLPPDWHDLSYSPYVQMVDLDGDEAKELVLAARAMEVTWGEFRIVYDFQKDTQTWHGTLVWPHISDDYSLFHWPRSAPLIRSLNFKSVEDQMFVLVEGQYGGADHTAKHLWIWQWRDDHPEVVLKIRLSNWCEYSGWDSWELVEEGIMIPAAEATWRCQARETSLYRYRDGQFISTMP